MPFNIFLELKPYVEYASIEQIVKSTSFDSYDAHFNVKYRGCEIIKVSIEEEYSPEIRVKYIEEPYIAYGIAENISDSFYAWIDFQAENEYGKSVYTIELQPGGVLARNVDNTANFKLAERDLMKNVVSQYYELYDIHGHLIGQFMSVKELNSISFNGIGVIRCWNNGEIVKIYKKVL